MATKASQRVQRYVNANGPTIGTVERRVIEQDGLYFKDIDGTGTVSAADTHSPPGTRMAGATADIVESTANGTKSATETTSRNKSRRAWRASGSSSVIGRPVPGSAA